MVHHERQSIMQNMRWLAGANLVVKPLWFLFLLMSTRMLGPEEFGKFMYAMSFVAVLGYLFEGGVDMFTMRELAHDPSRFSALFGQTTLLKVISNGFLAVATGVSVLMLGLPADRCLLIMLATVHMLFQSTTIHFRFIFRALEVMKFEARSIMLEKVMIVTLCGGAILISRRAEAFMIAFVAAYVITSISALRTVWKQVGFPHWSFDPSALWNNVLRPAMPFAFMGIFLIVYYRSATLFLQWLTGSDRLVGFYNAGYRLVEAFALLPTIVVMPLYATFARSHQEKSTVIHILPQAARVLLAVSVVVSLPMLLFDQEFTLLLFGADFLQGSAAIGLVVLTMVPVGMTWLFGNLAGAVNRQGRLNWFIVAITCGNLMCNWVLITRYGVMGAAVTTLLTELAMSFSAAWVVRDYVDFREFGKVLAGVFAPAAVVLVFGKMHLLPGAFVVQVSVALIFLAASFFAFGVVRIGDLRRLISL